MSLISSFNRLALSRPVQQYRTYVAAKQLRPTKFKSSKSLFGWQHWRPWDTFCNLLNLVLENVPPKPRSGWQIFCRENLKNYKGPDGKTNIVEANRALSSKWHSLSDADKEVDIGYRDVFMFVYTNTISSVTMRSSRRNQLLTRKPMIVFCRMLLLKNFMMKTNWEKSTSSRNLRIQRHLNVLLWVVTCTTLWNYVKMIALLVICRSWNNPRKLPGDTRPCLIKKRR